MRVRNEHWQLLLELCENNSELITGKFNGIDGKAKGTALWRNVATKLNSLGFGEKTVDGWRKTLIDWKSKTKAKAAALKREREKTGGGPNLLSPLSTLEERLIAIMGKKCVSGDEEVAELGFGEVKIAKSLKENASENTETLPQEVEIETSMSLIDHDYILENIPSTSSASGHLEKKRKFEGATSPHPPKKQQIMRRRPSQNLHLSSELLKLNRDTTNLLENIDNITENIANTLENISNNTKSIGSDIHSIADNLKIIATCLQNQYFQI